MIDRIETIRLMHGECDVDSFAVYDETTRVFTYLLPAVNLNYVRHPHIPTLMELPVSPLLYGNMRLVIIPGNNADNQPECLSCPLTAHYNDASTSSPITFQPHKYELKIITGLILFVHSYLILRPGPDRRIWLSHLCDIGILIYAPFWGISQP